MKKLGVFICLAALCGWNACTKNKSETNNVVSSTQVAKDSKPECENGKTPQVLEGKSCPGTWNLISHPKTHKKVCAFKYGPPISCPEGTKSTTYQAICYGEIVKEGTPPTSESDCVDQFGKVPNPEPYRLACCPQ